MCCRRRVAAVIAGLLANFLFTPPYGSFTITQPENAFALVVFVVVGVTVASVVDRSALRARQAARGRAEAQLVAAAATGVLNSADPVHAVLEQARVGFAMTSVLLLSGVDAVDGQYRVVSSAGDDVPTPRAGCGQPRHRRRRGHGRTARSRMGAGPVRPPADARRTGGWSRFSPPRRCWPSIGNG